MALVDVKVTAFLVTEKRLDRKALGIIVADLDLDTKVVTKNMGSSLCSPHHATVVTCPYFFG